MISSIAFPAASGRSLARLWGGLARLALGAPLAAVGLDLARALGALLMLAAGGRLATFVAIELAVNARFAWTLSRGEPPRG